MKTRIYLDNNASTSIDPRVFEAMCNHFKGPAGNPTSSHSFGQEMRNSLVKARHSIASFLRVKSNEIIFNSGGTEGVNAVIRGLLDKPNSGHVISSDVEHSCVYVTLQLLAHSGFCQTTFLSTGRAGAVTVAAVREALRPDTRLIVLMSVNNETGVKTDIEGIASLAEEARIPFLVDGVAILGKELFTIPAGVSAMCFSGHKLHAPKGIGFAFMRSTLKLRPLLTGGDQEYSRRGGTENLPGIIGLAEAIDILRYELPAASLRMATLRDRLEKGIMDSIPGVTINGEGARVVNTSNLSFGNIDGEALLTTLDMEGIAVSHGSACAAGALEPSRILRNMGNVASAARSSLRFSLSRFTTEEEIDICIDTVGKVVRRLQNIAKK